MPLSLPSSSIHFSLWILYVPYALSVCLVFICLLYLFILCEVQKLSGIGI